MRIESVTRLLTDVALAEYRLALALGATVALLRDSGGSVKKIGEDPVWNTLPNLMTVMPQRL